VESWEDEYELLNRVDLCVLGSVVYPAYEQYWTAALDPGSTLPVSGKRPTSGEVGYAKWASQTPHIVVSRKAMKVTWKNAQFISDLEEIRRLKQGPGEDIHVVGGASIVSSMMNLGLIDEIQLMINPILLGGSKALFKDLTARHPLKLVNAKPLKSGKASLTYSTRV
jgi:dihydrofolate reductase